MNEHLLTHILNQLAKEGVPDNLDLRPGIYLRLETSKTQPYKGVFSMKSHFAHPRRAAVMITLFFLLLAFGFLLTPQGQAWAQKLFQFFTPAENEFIPIPPEEVRAIPATRTPVPTFFVTVEEVKVLTPTPTNTPDPSCASQEAQLSYFCQIQAAEALAGFDAMELPFDPKGMKFSSATFNPERSEIVIEFVVISGGGYLFLSQGIGDYPVFGEWDQVPAEAIEQGTVDGKYAETVLGTFITYVGATSAEWAPGGDLRLRWRDDDRWFSLEKLGDPYPIEWIGKTEIINLAESLVDARPTNLLPPTDFEYLKSVEEAEELAGFDVPVPTFLPEGFEFKRAIWADNIVRLLFGPKNTSEEMFFLFMGPADEHEIFTCDDCENVQVGPWQGLYWRGIFSTSVSPITGQPTPTPKWETEARHWQLVWETDTLWFNMWYSPRSHYGGEMDKETMIKIAESLR